MARFIQRYAHTAVCPAGNFRRSDPGWAAMTGQQSRWRKLEEADLRGQEFFLRPAARLPSLAVSATESDPLLAIGSRLISAASEGREIHMRVWLMGNEWHLQERLSALSAYSYGTEGGVENGTPNPWECASVFCVRFWHWVYLSRA